MEAWRRALSIIPAALYGLAMLLALACMVWWHFIRQGLKGDQPKRQVAPRCQVIDIKHGKNGPAA